MSEIARIVMTAVYFLSWLVIATTLSVLLLWIAFTLKPDLGLDDDITYLVGIPLGFALAIPLGRKMRPFRRWHYGFLFLEKRPPPTGRGRTERVRMLAWFPSFPRGALVTGLLAQRSSLRSAAG